MNKKSKILLCETQSNFNCSPLWLRNLLPLFLCVSASHRRCASASLREKNEDNSVENYHQVDALRAETQKLEMVYNKRIAVLGELPGTGVTA